LEKRLGFWASALRATYGRKKNFETWLFAKIVVKNFQPVLFSQSRDNWGRILWQTDRQTDRQSHNFLDTIYGLLCVFLSGQNFLPPYLLRSQGINANLVILDIKVATKFWQINLLDPIYYAIYDSSLFDFHYLTNFTNHNFNIRWNRHMPELVADHTRSLETITKWLRGTGLVVFDLKTKLCLFHWLDQQ
jgi:hypothetical protein